MTEYKHGGINWGQAFAAEPVPYIEAFARSFDCVNTGLFLSFFTECCGVGEWVELSDNIVLNHTGLSTKRWHNVRRKLLAQGVLQNKRLVQPTRSMFSLNDEAFEQIMRTHNRPNHVGLFAPPLSINRLQLLTLVHINLAVRDVIFLVAMQERVGFVEFHERNNQWTNWVFFSEGQMESMTYLNAYAQRSAKNGRLKKGRMGKPKREKLATFQSEYKMCSMILPISEVTKGRIQKLQNGKFRSNQRRVSAHQRVRSNAHLICGLTYLNTR